jgi:hypothetical protein
MNEADFRRKGASLTMFLSWKTFTAEIVLDIDPMLDRWV